MSYEKYLPLFNGQEGDKRINKFLHELREQAEVARKARNGTNFVADEIQFKQVRGGMEYQHFEQSYGKLSPNALAPELVEYLGQVALDIGGSTSTDNNLLAIVRRVGSAAPGSDDDFVRALIQRIAMSVNGAAAGAGAVLNPSQWGSAASVTFENADKIVKALANAGSGFPHEALQAALNLSGPAAVSWTNNLATSIQNVEKILQTGPNNAAIKSAIAGIADDQTNWATNLANALKSVAYKLYQTTNKFTFKMNKFLLQLILDDAVRNLSANQTVDAAFSDAPSDQTYFRELDGTLYMMENGQKVDVGRNSTRVRDLKEENKCFGTGVVDNGGQTCKEYFEKCLAGRDIQQCKDFMKNTAGFWNTAVDEIQNMLPPIALKTLEAFQFKTVSVYDDATRTHLTKIQTVNEWTDNVLKKAGLADADLTAILKNDKLIGYLNALVDKVNNNLAILNPGYKVTGQRPTPSAFNGTYLAKLGLTPNYASARNVVANIDRLEAGIRQANNRIAISLGLPNLYGYSRSFILSGGGNLENTEANLANETKQTWSTLQRQYVGLATLLHSHGKRISQADDDKIKQLIENLRASEVKLLKIMLYTEKYAKLISVYGEKDPNGVLTAQHLKDFVDARRKYFERVSKKQQDVIAVIRVIAEAVNKELPAAAQGSQKFSDLNASIY